MSQPSRPGQPNPHVERSGTLIETDEEVRQAISGLKGQGQPESLPAAINTAASPTPNKGPSATLFRPTVRPPIAVLTVWDDGKLDGEVIRIRDQRFVIGRSEGDLKIPIDGRISSRHIEITLQTVGGQHRWVVTDLQSTHGMFVRVSRTVLAERAEFLVGNGRYRFDSPQALADATVAQVADPAVSGATQGWDGSPSPFRPPAVTALIGNEIGNRILLVKPPSTGSAPTRPARSAVPTIHSANCGTSACSALPMAPGMPSTTGPRTASGCECPRS